jgi:rare lipoprotein A
MIVRLGAAICGTAILLACSSAAMARTKVGVRSRIGVSQHVSLVDGTIIGAASMYNPYEPGYREGGPETASGERYDPSAWAAAIKTGLRGMFGGVRHGETPKYALVESAGRKVIIKINDVGPLTPGRVIDFDQQTMRYFDPSLKRGVIRDVRVTPLSGDGWTLGPVAEG